MQYEISSEVEKVADKVIKQYHPDLAHKTIRYWMLDQKDEKTGLSKTKKSNGKTIPAEIKILKGDAAFAASEESRTGEGGPSAVVVVKAHRMPWVILEPNEREGVIDAVLCRLFYDEISGAPSLLEYDAKLFAANVAHYGAYTDSIERLLNAAKDLPLFEENGKPKVQKAAAGAGNGKTEDLPKSDLPSIKDQVAKKRGRVTHPGN